MSKFKLFIQHDSMQCGIACLRMVCNYYGKAYSQDTISKYCLVTIEGVSLLGIREAASELGLHTVYGKATVGQLKQAQLPCILHWNQNHFVVLYKVRVKSNNESKYYIADPGKGLVKYDESTFCKSWLSNKSGGEEKGVAIFLQPTPLFYEREVEKVAQPRSFKFLFGYIKQYRRYFGQIILGLLVGSILQLIFPFLTA